jgi:hypothetical protein
MLQTHCKPTDCKNLKCVGRSPGVDRFCIRNRVFSEQPLGKA